MSDQSRPVGRRDFVKASMAATGSLLFVKPETAFGSQANSTPNMALLGCGGRGNGVAEDFVNFTDVQFTVLGDLFEDRIEETKKRFDSLQAQKGRAKVQKTFKGPNAHEQVAQSNADIVLIATPPYFHPLHLEAIVGAGKHVYLEKPVSTDVRGCMKVAEIGARIDGKLSANVGFQIRRGTHFAELTHRIHEGALGDIACVQGFYFAGDLPRKAKAGMSRTEAKLRDWVFDRTLGGDIMVEQNIHIIDVFNWVLKAHPVRAQATVGRKVRTDIGDVSDHFVVTYYYPNDVRASFMSTQFLPEWGSVGIRFFGPLGFSESFYTGGLRIVGKNHWEAGAENLPPGTKAPEVDPLGDATPNKAKAFVQGIKEGKFQNELKQGAESTLSAILGRQAAYEGREMSWAELLASDQHWVTDIDVSRL